MEGQFIFDVKAAPVYLIIASIQNGYKLVDAHVDKDEGSLSLMGEIRSRYSQFRVFRNKGNRFKILFLLAQHREDDIRR